MEAAVALSPSGDYLVYSRDREYFSLELTRGVTTRLVEAPYVISLLPEHRWTHWDTEAIVAPL